MGHIDHGVCAPINSPLIMMHVPFLVHIQLFWSLFDIFFIPFSIVSDKHLLHADFARVTWDCEIIGGCVSQ